MAWDKQVIWVGGKLKYFCEQGWTGRITLIRFDKFYFARTAAIRLSPAKLA
jgi:hypothetical protein